MVIITDSELNTYCSGIAANPILYIPVMKDLVNLQYKTGCRINDILQHERWTVLGSGNLQLQPQKDNNTREFEYSEVTDKFYTSIIENTPLYAEISYRKYQYHLRQILNLYGLRLGDKGLCSHIFRHNYARQLKGSGMTDNDIKIRLGERNQSSANYYIYSTINWWKPS